MSGKTRVEANLAGYTELRNSPEIVSYMQSIADAALSQLGEGYISTVRHYDGGAAPGKAVINVYAETPAAKRENLRENTIIKAVFGSS
jgi:hypothetical protein